MQTFSPSQVAAIYYQDKFQRDIAPEMLDMLVEAVKPGTKSRGGIAHEITETDY